jgi:outer membrane protein assembly factor BamD (BamD/ComL family)
MAVGVVIAAALTGCHGPNAFTRGDDKAPPTDSMIIHAGRVEETPATAFKGAADLANAEENFRLGDYRKAEKLYEKVADDTANPPLQAEKARYFEGECMRLRGDLPGAMGVYNRLLKDFQYGVFRERAVGRMYDIANFWLDDTRRQLDEETQRTQGKRWFVSWNFVHFNRRKPTFDEEGRALKALEQVYYNDPTGPYAEKSLYMAGYVQFRRGNFREADQLLSQAVEAADRNNRKSELRDQALELAILAKNNAGGGPDYDGRKAAESLKMIHQARMTSPELNSNRSDFLDNQAKIVRFMQAEKDYNIAEFYKRTGHPASAWFYYELVRRRYQGIEFHDKAVARMKEIHGDLAAQQQQSEFVKATRREWNKWALGHETPTLKDGQVVPPLPGEMPERKDSPILQTGGSQTMPPADFAPRR